MRLAEHLGTKDKGNVLITKLITFK